MSFEQILHKFTFIKSINVKKIFFIAIAIIPLALNAQQDSTRQTRQQKIAARRTHINQLIKQEEEGALIYQKQSAFGFKFNTNGFDFIYEHGKYKTINTTNLWWLELGETKSQKQERQSNLLQVGSSNIYISGNSYVYGKQNNLYFLRLGFGQQKLIGEKGNKNGVAVSAIYGGGPVLGMLKPYYVQYYNNANQTIDIKYTGNNDSAFLGQNVIGGSGFTKGFNEIQFVPGITARTAIRFDYGRYNEVLSAIEVGLNAEYYTQKMPIMVHGNEKNFFFNAYVALVFGKRK
jgi:hypothetical protein